MNQSVDQVLHQLAAAFTVRDVMVRTERLVRADSLDEARQLLAQHPEFDTIPLPEEGPITAYVQRDKPKLQIISSADLISDGTNLLDIPRLLMQRNFFFVLSSNAIAGFVHFSDLNKSIVKLPLFVLFEALERQLWPLVSRKLGEADLTKVLDVQRAETLMRRRAKAQEKDVDVGWSGLLSLDEILRFAQFYEIFQIADSERAVLASVRNRVAHPDRLLVQAQGDTAKLVKAYELCQKLLSEES